MQSTEDLLIQGRDFLLSLSQWCGWSSNIRVKVQDDMIKYFQISLVEQQSPLGRFAGKAVDYHDDQLYTLATFEQAVHTIKFHQVLKIDLIYNNQVVITLRPNSKVQHVFENNSLISKLID